MLTGYGGSEQCSQVNSLDSLSRADRAHIVNLKQFHTYTGHVRDICNLYCDYEGGINLFVSVFCLFLHIFKRIL